MPQSVNQKLFYLALLTSISHLVASQYEISQNANSPNVSKDDLQKINQIALINSAITFFQVASTKENLQNLVKITSDLCKVDYVRISFHIIASLTAILTANNITNKSQCISSQAKSDNGSGSFPVTLLPSKYQMGFIAIGTMLRGLLSVDDDKGSRLIDIQKDNLAGVMPALLLIMACFSTVEFDSITTLFGDESKKCTGIVDDADQYMLNIAVIATVFTMSTLLKYFTSQKLPVKSVDEVKIADSNGSIRLDNLSDNKRDDSAGDDRAVDEITPTSRHNTLSEVEVDSDQGSTVGDGDKNVIANPKGNDAQPKKSGGKKYDVAVFIPSIAAGSVTIYYSGYDGLPFAITAAATASAISAGLIPTFIFTYTIIGFKI